jgi:hypothetical protein
MFKKTHRKVVRNKKEWNNIEKKFLVITRNQKFICHFYYEQKE